LMVVRDGLDEFAHVHPAVDDHGNLTISHVFPQAGTYRLYADYKPKGRKAGIATAQIDVKGEPSPAPKLVVNVPGEVKADGVAAKIDISNAKRGQQAEVRFLLITDSGQPIEKLEFVNGFCTGSSCFTFEKARPVAIGGGAPPGNNFGHRPRIACGIVLSVFLSESLAALALGPESATWGGDSQSLFFFALQVNRLATLKNGRTLVRNS
jgi:hypothetical protein